MGLAAARPAECLGQVGRRMQEAIDIVRGRRREDGRWVLEHTYRGKTYFELERVGRPGRWTTLRALRVLRWWEGGR